MRRHLFICNTPFQIMMVLAFRMTILNKDNVEIIVSDIITNSESLYQNIKTSNIFNAVYYFKDYELDYIEHPKVKRWFRIINREKVISKLLPLSGNYDAFYATDTLQSIEWIYEVLFKRNPQMKMYYFEEGPISVIAEQGDQFRKSEEYRGKKKKLIEYILGIRHIYGHYSGAYISVKDQVPEKYFPWYDIPQVSPDKLEEYISILNLFWNYKDDGSFNEKIIFLEESYYVDGRENRDLEIVQDIVSHCGTEKVIVKLHPRTRKNRFERFGIKTYAKTSVPWELIALNKGFENSVLICVASGSIMYPKLYWGIEQTSIGLLNCKDYYFKELDGIYYRLIAKVCKTKQLAVLPENKKEFLKILDKYK